MKKYHTAILAGIVSTYCHVASAGSESVSSIVPKVDTKIIAKGALPNTSSIVGKGVEALSNEQNRITNTLNTATKHLMPPGLLFDQDGRAITDIRPEELAEDVQKRLKRHSCRILQPVSGLSLDFSDIEPAQHIERDKTFLINCPKGTSYRLVLLENGVPVSFATIGLYSANEERTGTARLALTTENYTPLNKVIFTSDGEPRAISLKAILSSANHNELIAGQIKEIGAVEIELLPN